MKTIKYSGLGLAVVAMLCSSCSKRESECIKAVFNIQDYELIEDMPATRTQLAALGQGEFIWSATDTVGIFPDDGAQVYYSMTGGAGANSAQFDGGGWAFKPGSVYYSYFPVLYDMLTDKTHIPVSYLGQRQNGTNSTLLGKYDYMYTEASQAEGGVVAFGYKHLGCIIRPKVTLPAGTYTKLAVTAPSAVFATEGWFNLLADEPSIVPSKFANQISIDLDNVTLTEPTTFYVHILSAPVNLQGTEITVSVLDSQRKEYQCKKTPSAAYTAGKIGGLTCDSFTEVPQSMGMIITPWEDGGNYSGSAD